MVIIRELNVQESKGVKRVTITKQVADHLNINKGDPLFMFVIGNIICYATDRETVKVFLERVARHLTDFFIV